MRPNKNSRRSILKAHRRLRRKSWSKNSCLVYVLREAIHKPPRYVGQTRAHESVRLHYHIKTAQTRPRSPVERWIASLLANGAAPIIEVIDRQGIWDISEAVWIDRLRSAGADLLNVLSVVPLAGASQNTSS